MRLADIAEFECTDCGKLWTEYYGLLHSTDESQLTDRKLCERCGELTDCHHPSRRAIDPQLEKLFCGNTGRILSYLRKTRELIYEAWRPELGLPSPAKIGRICRPLEAADLVQVCEDRICLTPAGVSRLARYDTRYPCGVCGAPYPAVCRCPRCGRPLTLILRGCVDARIRPV
jgi:hypothetical protein